MEQSTKPTEATLLSKKIPKPIYLKLTQKWREFIQKVNELVGSEVNKKKVINGDIIRFFLNSITHYLTIQNFFEASKFEFFRLSLNLKELVRSLLKASQRIILLMT